MDIVYFLVKLIVTGTIIIELTLKDSMIHIDIPMMIWMIVSPIMIFLSAMVTFAITRNSPRTVNCYSFTKLFFILSLGILMIAMAPFYGFYYQIFLLWLGLVWWMF